MLAALTIYPWLPGTSCFLLEQAMPKQNAQHIR
jgi:hypothetical protein